MHYEMKSSRKHVQRARGFWKRGDLWSSLRELHDALLVNPDEVEALYGIGRVRASRGEYSVAVWALERAAALDPNNPGVYLALADALLGASRASEAAGYYRRVLRLDRGDLARQAREGLNRIRLRGRPVLTTAVSWARTAAALTVCMAGVTAGTAFRLGHDPDLAVQVMEAKAPALVRTARAERFRLPE
jgi:tetratricopeptide (TPR) repeat protein